ncbi:MAG TPA: type II secretion system F family protein [Candidatus Nanoarchaeia archaeon]|nr:type II secretion system F family protein [Candidatus Nanoarchaeia archaeon]
MFLVFLLVLVLTFAIVFFVLRPSRTEKDLENRLSGLRGSDDATSLEEDAPDILKRNTLSDIPLIDVVLTRLAPAARLHVLLSQANLRWSVGRVVAGSVVLLVAATYIAGFFLPLPALQIAIGIAAGASIYVYIFVKRSMRFAKFAELLPDAIDLITRGLKAGHSVNATIEMVSREIPDPVGTEFRKTFEEQNFGLPMREAMTNLADRVPLPDLQFLVTAILVQKETGGNLVEILEKTASVIRERLRLRGQLRIYTAQGRLTGWILAAMPFIVFVGMNILNPAYGKILFEDPLGRKLVYTGLVMMAIGGYLIRKIVDVKV